MKKRIEDIKSYINEVTDLIKRYIKNYDEYPKGARLLVEPVLCETVIDDPRGCRGVEQYNINRFFPLNLHYPVIDCSNHLQFCRHSSAKTELGGW